MNHLNLHDRINVIGVDTVKDICSRAHSLGVEAVAIGQHEEGGFFTPQYTDPVKDVLNLCHILGMKVILRTHDVSKFAYGNPAGWPLNPYHFHRPRKNIFTIDTQRSAVKILCHAHQAYEFSFELPERAEMFLLHYGQQIARLGTGQSGFRRFVSHYGPGEYEIIFRFFTPAAERKILINHLNTISCADQTFFGSPAQSGHYLARTANHSNRAARVASYGQTFRRIYNEYGNYRGTIVGTIADADEFAACGGTYKAHDLVRSLEDLALLSNTLWNAPLYAWMRPGDWDAHTGHANYPEPDRPRQFDRACQIPGFVPIVWEEQTTLELCQENFKRVPNGIAGVYLEKSNPEHFQQAGFKHFSAFWWPQTGQSYEHDFPWDALERTIEVFQR